MASRAAPLPRWLEGYAAPQGAPTPHAAASRQPVPTPQAFEEAALSATIVDARPRPLRQPAPSPASWLSLRIVRPEAARRGPSGLPRTAMAASGMLLGLAGSALFASGGSETTAEAIRAEAPVEASFTAPVSPAFNPADEGIETGPATPDPTVPLSGAQREAIEAAMAVTGYAGPAPANAALRFATNADRERALTCMTQAIYYEAGNEPEAGQRAVAQVVLNRMRHPDYPNTVCGVVYQTCQFTFTCDGALARRPVPAIWARSRRYAEDALAGRGFAGVGYSTHYHTIDIWPYWADVLPVTTTIARHIFHRMPGSGSAPGAFTARHPGREPPPRPYAGVILRTAASSAAPGADPQLSAIMAAAEAQARAAADRLPPAPVPVAAEAQRIDTLPAPRNDRLPDSTVRPEFRESGRWIGG